MKHISKKRLGMLLVLCTLFMIKPVIALADPVTVTNQTELQTAINNATSDTTIILGNDISVENSAITINSAYSFTINLNGKKLSSYGTNIITHNGAGNVTIMGGRLNAKYGDVIYNSITGSVTILDSTIDTTTGYAINNNGTGSGTISGSEVYANNSHAIYNKSTGSVIISECLLAASAQYAIKSPTGSVTIQSGTVTIRGNAGAMNGTVPIGYDNMQIKAGNDLYGGDAQVIDSATLASNLLSYKYIQFSPIPTDEQIVAAAKSAAEGASYANMTQAVTTSETHIATALKATAEASVNNGAVTVIINQVSYTAPIAGTSANPDGTDGSYVFTITVSKGAQTQTTMQKTISITATAFDGITDVQAIAAAISTLNDGTVNVAFGADQATKTAAVQAYVNDILSGTADALGVTATVTYNNVTGKYDVALNKGSVNDNKSLTMTVNVAPAPPAPAGGVTTTDTNKETKTITIVEVPQRIPDKKLLTVEAVGEAFDNSVEVRLKEDTTTEDKIRTAMEAVSSALNLDNVQIFPLDISIYLKGTDTKVQPKEGTAVIITCPLPTEMLVNMDKLVVVCVIDGKLQVLPVTLVTKEGVLCVQFTATHFSPYAIVIDKDNKLADYDTGILSDVVTNLSTRLTATAGTVTKVDLEGIKEGSVITYHVCTPTLISIDNDGNLFTKKAGNAILMAKVTNGGATTLYTIRVKVKSATGGTKVGFIRYYDETITYNKINYRITDTATDTVEGTVAVANNQINKYLPNKVVIPATITHKGKTYRVTSIDESAFYNLNKITSVAIPAGVEEISATAFVSCDSLKTFTVSSKNKYYSANKGMLLNREGTTLIAYPSAKGNIVIDKKIAVIGSYAFSACKYLTGVVLPQTVTRMEGCAFAHSKSISKVTFLSLTVPEMPYPCIFDKVNEACTILVPESSLLKYQDALNNARMPKGARVVRSQELIK